MAAAGCQFLTIKKGVWLKCYNPLKVLVRLAGFEPATYGLEVRCSIQLSYRRKEKLKIQVPYFRM
jgi:hypothetical protein